ncbi:MAG: PAS domain-containing protein [Deltaproteobacteria bacterium]|nr:PAS domain-containing protein [Deltaproteobacteria bacterium]
MLKQERKKGSFERGLMETQRALLNSLASTDNLSKGLHLCLEACLQVSDMDCGGIYLIDDTTGNLNLMAHKGFTEDFVNSFLTYDKGSKNTLMVMKGKPLYTLLRNLDTSLLTQVQRREGLRAFATVPLFDKTKVIGCTNIASHILDEIPISSRIAVETIVAETGIAIARLKAQKALMESEEHLRSLMLNAEHYAVYRLAISPTSPHKLAVVFVSPSIVNIMGVTNPENFELWFENIHADDKERIIEANSIAFQTLRFDEVMRIYHPQKKEHRWIHAISKGITNQHDNIKYVNGVIIDITKRKLIEEALAIKEKQLENKTHKLEEINTALNVLLKQREEDKIFLQERIILNVKNMITPYIDMLRKDSHNENQAHLFDALESNLNDIISTFSLTLSSEQFGLTPTEMLVADLIRQGKKTKEIAKVKNISCKTVEVHRNNIRKKFGLLHKKINLQSYLLSLA